MLLQLICVVLLFGSQHVSSTNADYGSNSEVPDTEEFDSGQQKVIKQFNDTNARNLIKKQCYKLIQDITAERRQALQNYTSEKRLSLSRNFDRFFYCAINTIQSTIQFYYNQIKKLPCNIDGHDVEYPPEFHNLNKTHDFWLDYQPSVRKMKPKPTRLIYKSYKVWLNFLNATSYDDLLDTRSFALYQHILSRLNEIRRSDPSRYPTTDSIYKLFSVSMSRLFRIACAIRYDVEPRFLEFAHLYPSEMFCRVLLNVVRGWHVTTEDILFVNILIEFMDKRKNIIQYVSAENQFNETVVIPYENLDTCIYQEMDKSKIPFK